MRYRITVRGEFMELRGYIDGEMQMVDFAAAMQDKFDDTATIVVSPASKDYNPFGKQQEGGSLGGF